MNVRDIQAIRFQNLHFLVQECSHLLGRERGAVALLATRSGVHKSLLSVLLSGTVHSTTQRPRLIGDETATKLERGMDKPDGWMDIDRSAARDFREAALLDKLRLLNQAQRESIERMLDEFLPTPAGDKNERAKA